MYYDQLPQAFLLVDVDAEYLGVNGAVNSNVHRTQSYVALYLSWELCIRKGETLA